MTFWNGVRRIDWGKVFLAVIAFIPYVDTEILGILPVVRDLAPEVEPIYLTRLSWTEILRLSILIVIPYVDGEILQLVGVDVREVISD